jgi:hypothetical protein
MHACSFKACRGNDYAGVPDSGVHLCKFACQLHFGDARTPSPQQNLGSCDQRHLGSCDSLLPWGLPYGTYCQKRSRSAHVTSCWPDGTSVRQPAFICRHSWPRKCQGAIGSVQGVKGSLQKGAVGTLLFRCPSAALQNSWHPLPGKVQANTAFAYVAASRMWLTRTSGEMARRAQERHHCSRRWHHG